MVKGGLFLAAAPLGHGGPDGETEAVGDKTQRICVWAELLAHVYIRENGVISCSRMLVGAESRHYE